MNILHYIIPYITLIIGFVLLIKGADYFVDGCISVAKKFKISSMIIGLTIVAMGTSAPEFAVSSAAAIKGISGIAVGNVIGSNIFNLLVVTGICVVLRNMKVQSDTLKRDFPVYLLSIVILLITVLPVLNQQKFIISRLDGVILVLAMIVYMTYLINSTIKSRKENSNEEEDSYNVLSPFKTIIYIVLGITAVIVGGESVVRGSKEIASQFNVADGLIGLTIVALGTSLPELVTSIAAIRKGEDDIAIGNVIGSNIFNTLIILGVSSVIAPITIDYNSFIDIVICIIVSALVMLFCIHKSQLNKIKGISMLAMYGIFLSYILTR